MDKLAIIGGTGLPQLKSLKIVHMKHPKTRWGNPSAPLSFGTYNGQEVIFLPRHGVTHSLLPHQINYRANLWALKEQQVNKIIAINTVGGINKRMAPGTIVIPDQIIDYTWGRKHSFELGQYPDFSDPYDPILRKELAVTCQILKLPLQDNAVHAVTQGPRLETAAEIDRLAKDGCDIVGMTGMPEAALARELDIPLVCCALVVNWGSGRMNASFSMSAIKDQLKKGNQTLLKLLEHFFMP